MKMKCLLFALILLCIASAASVSVPASKSFKTENGITVSETEITSKIYADYTEKCFYVRVPESLKLKGNFDHLVNIISSKTHSSVSIRNVTSGNITVEISPEREEDTYVVLPGNITEKNGTRTVPAVYEERIEYEVGDELTTLDFAASKEYFLCLRTDNAKSDGKTVIGNPYFFNMTMGPLFVDPNASCGGNLATANTTYTMDTNCTTGNGVDAFTVLSPNVTLDCAGYAIISTGVLGIEDGVYSDQANTTIRNCTIIGFTNDIFLTGADDANISYTAVHATSSIGMGVALLNADRTIISYLNGTSSANRTMHFYQSTYTQASYLNITGKVPIYLSNSDYNSFSNFNLTGGSTHDAILMGGGSDYNNFTDGIIIANYGAAYMPGASYTTFDRVNMSYLSSSASNGPWLAGSSSYNTFKNGFIRNWGASANAIVFAGTSVTNNNVTNMTIHSNGTGAAGAYFNGGEGAGHVFLGNNITAGGWWWRDATSATTLNNSTTGNAYNFLNGTKTWETCSIYDTSGDNWAEVGSDIPFNSSKTCLGGNWSTASDWHPYTEDEALNCSELGTANTVYTMSNDTSIYGATCFNVTAANVTIDCNGYDVVGDNSTDTYGIFSNQFNTTITNCNILNFQSAVYFEGADNGTIEDSTLASTHNSGRGIDLNDGADCNLITNCTVTSYKNVGMYMHSNSNNNTIINSSGISTLSYGMYLTVNQRNTIVNSTAKGGDDGLYLAYENGTAVSNSWIEANLSGSALLLAKSNHTVFSNNTINGSGVEAIRFYRGYGSTNNTFTNNTLISDMNMIQVDANSFNNTFYKNILNNTGSTAISIAGANNTIDCGGLPINGTNATGSYGVNSTGFGTIVRKCNISNFQIGIYFSEADNGTIEDTNASSSHSDGYGIELYNDATFNNVSNCRFTSYLNASVLLMGGADNNTFKNNTLISGKLAEDLLIIAPSTQYNTFFWNNFTNTTALYANDTGTDNYYNYSANGTNLGNFWHNVLNASVNVYGATTTPWSGFNYSSKGAGYPYNASHSNSKVTDVVIDYAAITAQASLACGVFDSANTEYAMTNDTSTYGASCINITTENITLNCNGHNIIGDNTTDTTGIYSNHFNTTIRNCSISGFENGIYFHGADNGTIENVTTNSTDDSGVGIYVSSFANYNNITNSIGIATAGSGISVAYGSYNSIINGTFSSLTNPAISLSSSSSNTILNCTGTASNMGIYLYNSSNNQIVNSSGNSSANTNIGVYIQASSNNTLSGMTISGKESTYGSLLIYTESRNNTVSNSTINGGSATYAVTLQSSNSSNNTFINNTILNATNLVYLDADAGGNLFYWNNFTNVSGYHVSDSNGSNYYNYSANGTNMGNFWFDVVNGTVSITGTTATPWAGFYYGYTGAGYPYNSTHSIRVTSGVTDYAPLTGSTAISCQELDTANTVYNMTNDTSTYGATCFNVTAENVTLNCAGYDVVGNNSTATYGVYSNQFNTTIKNCNISNFSEGVYFNGADNGTIEDTNVTGYYSGGNGILISSGDFNVIERVKANGSVISAGAIWMNKSSYNSIRNTTATTSYQTTVYMVDGGYNNISDSAVTSFYDYGIYFENSPNGVVDNASVTSLISNSIMFDNSSNGVSRNVTANSTNQSAIKLYGSGDRVCENFTISKTVAINIGDLSGYGAIELFDCNNSYITNSTGTSVTGRGVYLDDSINNTISNSSFSSGGEDTIYAEGSLNNTFSNNSIESNDDNSTLVYITGTSTGNYFYNNTFGLTNATAINDTGTNNTFDCAGVPMVGNNSSANYGIYAEGVGITIRKCGISNYTHGIWLFGADNATIYLTNASSTFATGNGIYIYSTSTGNLIANSTFNSTVSSAMHFSTDADNNTIINNTLVSGNQTGNLLEIESTSGGNKFYWNNFTNTSGYYVNDTNGGNFYNYTASGTNMGNFWYNVVNKSVSIYGNITTTWSGFYYGAWGDHPYNSSNSLSKVVNVTDNAPLTLETYSQTNTSEYQDGYATNGTQVEWSVLIYVNGSVTANYTTQKLGIEDNTTITDTNGVEITNGGNASHINFTGNSTGSPYNITFHTYAYNETQVTYAAAYTGLLGTGMLRIAIITEMNQTDGNVSYYFDEPMPSGASAAWLYLCENPQNSSCTETGTWTLQSFSTLIEKSFSLYSNETVLALTYTSSTSAGGGSGFVAPPPNETEVTMPIEVITPIVEPTMNEMLTKDFIFSVVSNIIEDIDEFLKGMTLGILNLLWVLLLLLILIIYDNYRRGENRRNFTSLTVMSVMMFAFLVWNYSSLLNLGW